MLINAGFEAAFDFAAPTTVLLLGNIHPTRTASIRRLERLTVSPAGAINPYFDLYGNQCGRTTVPAGRVMFRTDAVVEDSGLPDAQVPQARQHPVHELPDDVLLYLLGEPLLRGR